MITWQEVSAGEHRTVLAGEAGNIEAIIHVPESFRETDVKSIAVCCHPHPLYEGSMSNKVVHTLAKVMTKLGMVAVRFNFRGVGNSEGEYAEGIGETRDLVAICNMLKEQYPEAQIWLSGFSFGSYIAANAAAEVNAAQLITVSPAIEHFDFTKINKPNSPWLVIMGELDEVVSPTAVFNWVEQNPDRYELIKFPDTGHFYHGKLVKLTDLLVAHFTPVVEAL